MAHYFIQFIAWSVAPGNTAIPISNLLFKVMWPIFSFPLFYIAPARLINHYFEICLFFNSTIWAFLITLLIRWNQVTRK